MNTAPFTYAPIYPIYFEGFGKGPGFIFKATAFPILAAAFALLVAAYPFLVATYPFLAAAYPFLVAAFLFLADAVMPLPKLKMPLPITAMCRCQNRKYRSATIQVFFFSGYYQLRFSIYMNKMM